MAAPSSKDSGTGSPAPDSAVTTAAYSVRNQRNKRRQASTMTHNVAGVLP